MKTLKRFVAIIMLLCLVLPVVPSDSASAKSIKLSKKSVALYEGQTKTIKLKGVSGKAKVKWKTSKKKIVSIAKKKGNTVTFSAKKKGSAVITATYQKKQYKCKVKVKAKATTIAPRKTPTAVVPTKTPIAVPTTAPTETPIAAPTEIPTEVPTAVPTETPNVVPTEIPTEMPTAVPTETPNVVPTEIPTEVPTAVPTETPNVVPTEAPTEMPTTVPTVVPTETPVVTSVADNYQKLAKHIQKNGRHDLEDQYYYIDDIISLDTGNIYMQIRYNLDGSFEFSMMRTVDTISDTASVINLSITPPEYFEGAIVEILSLGNTSLYATGVVDIPNLSQTNTKITYNYTNASIDLRESLYELGEVDLSLGLLSWELLLQTSDSGLTLQDLGFTSYDI